MHGKLKFWISKLFWLVLIILAFVISVSLTRFFMEKGIDWNWAMYFYFNEYWVYIAMPFVLLGFIVPPGIVFYLYRWSKKSKAKSPTILFKRSLWALLTSCALLIILKFIVFRTRIMPFEKLSYIGQSKEFWFNFEQQPFGWETFFSSWPSGHAMIATALSAALLRHLTSSLGRNLLLLYTIIISLSVSTAFNWMSDVAIGIIIGLFIGGYVREKEFKVK